VVECHFQITVVIPDTLLNVPARSPVNSITDVLCMLSANYIVNVRMFIATNFNVDELCCVEYVAYSM